MRACLFSYSGDYDDIQDQLGLYIGSFEYEQDVEPFMLTYRHYELFVLDLAGMDRENLSGMMARLPGIMRCHGTKTFAAWNAETMQVLQDMAPVCPMLKNFVNCDQPAWVSELLTSLRAGERLRKYGDEHAE